MSTGAWLAVVLLTHLAVFAIGFRCGSWKLPPTRRRGRLDYVVFLGEANLKLGERFMTVADSINANLASMRDSLKNIADGLDANPVKPGMSQEEADAINATSAELAAQLRTVADRIPDAPAAPAAPEGGTAEEPAAEGGGAAEQPQS